MTGDAVGGVWTYALELARALGKEGVSVALGVMGPPPTAEARAEAEELPNLTLRAAPFRLEWMPDPWDDVERVGDWLLALKEEIRPEVVHLNGYAHGALPWRAPTVVVGHSCVCSWWEAVKGSPAPDEWNRYRREVARGLRAARLVVAPTRAMLDALERHYGPLTASTIIPNGRDADVPAADKESLVFAAGRVWDEAKNLGTLARVAPRLAWPVAIAGDERPPEGQGARLTEVTMLGRLSAQQIAGWYARASIYALPARYEPFGLTALEAAQAGCALVLGDIESLREVWGDAALFVPPDDEDALASTLNGLIMDAALRAEFAARAARRARAFTPRRMASAYLAAYRSVLQLPLAGTAAIPPSRSRVACA
jgi:glycogen synthase